MPAYWVARSRIIDPIEYKKYTDRVPAIIARFGGKVLARGGRFQIMEGPDKFTRFVVIEFPTFEQGVACFTSEEYNKAAAFRRSGAGEVETIMVDAGDAKRFRDVAEKRFDWKVSEERAEKLLGVSTPRPVPSIYIPSSPRPWRRP